MSSLWIALAFVAALIVIYFVTMRLPPASERTERRLLIVAAAGWVVLVVLSLLDGEVPVPALLLGVCAVVYVLLDRRRKPHQS